METKSKKISILPGRSFSGRLVNNSLDYTENYVDEGLHKGLSDAGIGYNSEIEEYSAEPEDVEDVKGPEIIEDKRALLDCRQAFLRELQQYVEGADPRYRTRVNLMDKNTWSDVMAEVEITRDEYKGVGKKGIMKSIHNGWRNFSTAAPAIEAWLQLLPNNTLYGSVLCGGLTIIMEVRRNGHSIRLLKLNQSRQLSALDSFARRLSKRSTRFLFEYREHNSLCEHIMVPIWKSKLQSSTRPS